MKSRSPSQNRNPFALVTLRFSSTSNNFGCHWSNRDSGGSRSQKLMKTTNDNFVTCGITLNLNCGATTTQSPSSLMSASCFATYSFSVMNSSAQHIAKRKCGFLSSRKTLNSMDCRSERFKLICILTRCLRRGPTTKSSLSMRTTLPQTIVSRIRTCKTIVLAKATLNRQSNSLSSKDAC